MRETIGPVLRTCAFKAKWTHSRSLTLGSRSMVTRARCSERAGRLCQTDRQAERARRHLWASLVAKPAPLAAPWVSRRILLCLLAKTEPADGEPIAELGDADGVIAG